MQGNNGISFVIQTYFCGLITTKRYNPVTLTNRNLLYEEFGRRLAAVRKSKRLSQENLGVLVGLSRTSITNIERGRQCIQLHQLYQFASALRTDLDQLLPKHGFISEGSTKLSSEAQYLQAIRKAVLNKANADD